MDFPGWIQEFLSIFKTHKISKFFNINHLFTVDKIFKKNLFCKIVGRKNVVHTIVLFSFETLFLWVKEFTQYNANTISQLYQLHPNKKKMLPSDKSPPVYAAAKHWVSCLAPPPPHTFSRGKTSSNLFSKVFFLFISSLVQTAKSTV